MVKNRIFICVFTVVVALSIGSLTSSSFIQEKTVIEKTNIADPEWKKVSNGILVWGKNQENGLTVDLYDGNLTSISTFSRTIPGFTPSVVRLFYCGVSYYDFLLEDKRINKLVILRLSSNLNYIGTVPLTSNHKSSFKDSLFTLLPARLSQSLANYRLDSIFLELRVDTIINSGGKKSLKPYITKSEEPSSSEPLRFRTKWKYEFDSTSPEYAQFIVSAKGRIYVYVNYDTNRGEQYIYCLDSDNGALIFKTKLSIDGAYACIYSNYFLDGSGTLFVGGTGLYSHSNMTGTFIVGIGSSGSILTSMKDDGIGVIYGQWTQKYAGQSGGHGMRNDRTYWKMTSMTPDPTGNLQIFTDCFAMIYKIGLSNNIQTPLQDSDFHYLLLENIPLKYSGNSIGYACPTCGQYVTPIYTGHQNFNGVQNCVIPETHFIDKHYADNVNLLVDSRSEPKYYVDHVYDPQSRGNQVLLKFPVQYGSNTTELFYKAFFKGGKMDFSWEPMPVLSQNINVKSLFEIRDSKTLYKFTPLAEGYKLEISNW